MLRALILTLTLALSHAVCAADDSVTLAAFVKQYRTIAATRHCARPLPSWKIAHLDRV